ncbi:MAG: succinate dehydrogenase, hydrophobic membrane anchor protein [Xanthobacteraceae bacterium]
MNDARPSTLRTSLSRVRYLGSAHAGTQHFWRQRVTAVALLPLTIAFIIIVTSLLGRNHAAVVQVIGSPPVAILMLLFIVASTYHMWLGMQVVIEDYVHDDLRKFLMVMLNGFFSFAVALGSIFAILKLSFGV